MFRILCRRNVVIHGQDRVDSGCPGLEQALLRIRGDIDAVIRLDEEFSLRSLTARLSSVWNEAIFFEGLGMFSVQQVSGDFPTTAPKSVCSMSVHPKIAASPASTRFSSDISFLKASCVAITTLPALGF